MDKNLNEFKFSKYNHKIILQNDLYLYNALSGGFCKVKDENKNILKECDLISNYDTLRLLEPNIIKELIRGGMLIHKDVDEFNLIKSIHNMSRYGGKNSLGLTLLPTMGCNFRCTYCFEKETQYPNGSMTEEVMDEIVRLVDNNLSQDGNLIISWFGGEPLLEFKCIESLQTRINDIIKKKNLNFFGGIVTNGYLLTKEISDKLVSLGIKTAQITLDGTKLVHNEKRILKNGRGTYDKIIKNILNKSEDLEVGIRVNIDKNNIDSISEFIDFINESGIGSMKNVGIYFAVVRDYDTSKNCISPSCYNIEDFSKEELELNKMAYEKGINISSKIKPNLEVCGALSPSTFVIEPDGTIQKCWSTVGDKNKMVGHLLKKDYDRYTATSNQIKWYSWSGYEKLECKECNVLPLCMGGCPYYSVYEEELYKNTDYKCNTLKYNLEDTLKLIAYKYINNK